MQMAEEHLSTAMIDQTMRFAASTLDAHASIFCWIGPEARVSGYQIAGASADMMDDYFRGCYVHDPLNVYEVAGFAQDILFLEQERVRRSDEENRLHMAFLNRYGMQDEVNFIFRHDGLPFALLAVLTGPEAAGLSTRLFNFNAMHDYLEFNLKMHPRVRRARQEMMLSSRFGLTPREIEVVDLLRNGASNMTIAQIMGIGVATVKTYVINILNKLGVDNRAAIIAFLAAMQLP